MFRTLTQPEMSLRRPLRFQIVVRIVVLLSLTVAGITFANIRSTAAQNRKMRRQQVEQISQLLSTSRFPLTANVLNDMKSLSGVDFVVTKTDGSVFAQSSGAPDIQSLNPSASPGPASLGTNAPPPKEQVVQLEGKTYLHSAVPIKNQNSRSTMVHVFVSQQSVSDLGWQSAQPSLLIAAIVFPIAFALALTIAGRVIRPLGALQQQVQNIAQGQLAPIALPPRDDEIRDLSISINEMSARLEEFESETRNSERLQTLVRVGSGIAHNLRNCATGCKMAIELLESENGSLSGTESLVVAKRQISLMSKYIDRFINLSQTEPDSDPAPLSPFELQPVLNSVVSLLNPTAIHLHVELSATAEPNLPTVRIHPEDFEQLCINLITNAITATSEHHIRHQTSGASVSVTLTDPHQGFVELTVTDNGPGPDLKIAPRLFEPFVSGSREGVGLGLSLSAEIVEKINGEISWHRMDEWTHFCVLMPIHAPIHPLPEPN